MQCIIAIATALPKKIIMKKLFIITITIAAITISCKKENFNNTGNFENFKNVNVDTPYTTAKLIDTPYLNMKVIDTPYIGMKFIDTPYLGMKVIDTPYIGMKVIDTPYISLKVIDTPYISFKLIDTPYLNKMVTKK